MLLLKARLALELPPINKALSRAAEGLPHPVRPIARHIFEAGGKRLRPLLTILMARLLGYDKKRHLRSGRHHGDAPCRHAAA